ncbi:MAG TPA: hypothetical protein VJ831_12505 [Jatrophihabitantaceae bacterium]|nr:hypothetical protein [Jatrophihabitantaceae bacterium]
MNRNLRTPAAVLGAAAVGTLMALVVGVGAQAASAATSVPLKAFYSGTFTPTSTGFAVGGTGHATTLGNSSNQGTVVIQSQPNPSCPTTGFVVINDETLTAADGDQLTLSILDQPCPVTGEPGIYDGVSTYHVTGGTGRFAGASGQGWFDGRGDFTDPNHLTFTYTFNGTVSAPNAG